MKRSIQKILGVFLVLAIVFTSVPLSGLAIGSTNSEFDRNDTVNAYNEIETNSAVILKNPQLFSELDGSDLDGAEVYHDKNSRTYLLEDGSYVTRFFDEPITYIDNNGEEKDVDNKLVTEGQYYTNKANSYDVSLPKNGDAVVLESEGHQVTLIPNFGDLVNGVVKDNAIRYNSVADGVDLQYTTLGSGVKEDIILNYPSKTNSFSYKIKASGISFVHNNNTVYGYAKKIKEPIVTISAPLMTDASGIVSQGVALTLSRDGLNDILTVTPDTAWLAAPDRAYPVTIDPTWKLQRSNLTVGVIQMFGPGGDYGANVEHINNPYLYAGFEDGSLVATNGIVYGMSRSYVKINDITPYIAHMPDVAILDVKLKAYKYADQNPGQSKQIDAKMISSEWRGNGKLTWNNCPDMTDLANGQNASGSDKWLEWDISDAFREWKRVPSSNRGIMLYPRNENQPAVCFSGTGNVHGQQALYVDVNWTVPNPVDEKLPLNAPIPKLWVLSNKAMYSGKQDVTGVFATGEVRPGLRVDYNLNDVDGGTYDFAEYGKIWPDTTQWENAGVPITLGYHELYEGNWQTKLFQSFMLNTVYSVYAQGTLPATDTEPEEITPVGKSDDFIIYKFRETDTLPYVADYYGVARDTIVKDNRTGTDLAHPGNTIFIRNPKRNATIPYSRPDSLTIEHMRDIIYASMGIGECSEFDMEPVNMNIGNFFFESIDAENTEYNGNFQLVRSYNSLGSKSLGAFGRGWSFEYSQFLTGREDGGMNYRMGDGKQIIFPQSGNGWSSPVGHNLSLTKLDNTDPHLVQYTITDAYGKVFLFNSYGILIKVTDEKGFVTELHFDANYKLTGITTGSGRNYSFRTNAEGQIIEVIMPNSGVLKYEYNTDGDLTAFVNADGDRVRYVYNNSGLMSEWYDGNNSRVIQNEYDAQGRVIKQIDAAGGESTLTYTDGKTTFVNAEGATKVYEYDNQFRTKSIDDAENSIDKTFNANNQLTETTDKTGATTYYDYDSKGNITKETREDGTYREITYNALNKPQRIRDFDGAVTTNEYDTNGNLTKATNPDGSTVSYTYDQYGRTTSIIDGENNKTTFAYNGLVSMVMTDPMGNETSCYYDAMGRLINEVDPLDVEHKTMYSPNGKKIGLWQSGDISEEYKFDGAGNCIEVIDANGNKSSFAYNPQNKITKATNPLGTEITYTYDKLGRKLTEKDASGSETKYQYDYVGNLTQVTDAAGNKTVNHYDETGRLVETTDKNGNSTTYEYDDILNLLQSVTTSSGTTKYSYDPCGRISEIVNPDGSSENYSYDNRGRTEKTVATNGLVTEYSYNTNGQVTKTHDSIGRVIKSEYDKNGNLVKATDPMGRVSIFEYDKVGRIVEQTLPGDLKTQYTYDKSGNMTQLEKPDGSTVKQEYDKNGNLLAMVDANGARTEYRYNAVNDLIAQINALGGTQTFSYNNAQLLTEQTGELSQKTKYEYDNLNRPAKSIDPNGNATTFTYDKNGNVSAVIGADGSRTETIYDAQNHIIKITDAEGFVTEYQYDSMGRKTKEWDSSGYSMTFKYNSAGQVSKQTDSLNRIASYEYDLLGNLVKSVDFNGDITTYEYDLLSRPIKVTDNEGKTTTFMYDVAGNLIEQKDSNGRSNRFEYNKLGLVIKAINPAAQETLFDYDVVGNTTAVTYPNQTTNLFEYDKLGRKLTEKDANGNKTTYEYDASSRLLKQENALNGYQEFIYDAAGNIIKAKDSMGNITEYTYDNMLRASQVKSPRGAVSKFTYNKQGNPVTELDALGAVTEYAYYQNGVLKSKTLPNGLVNSYIYDSIGRITKVANSAGQFLETSYDLAGNVASETDQSGRTSSYVYDAMHRLLSTTNPKGDKTNVVYDSAGNLSSIVSPQGYKTSFQYDVLDRMTKSLDSVGREEEYTYDAMGNVIQSVVNGKRVNAYTFDNLGNMTNATNPKGQKQTYQYDELSRLTKQTDYAKNSFSYSYDANGNMTQVRDRLNNVTNFTYDAHNNLTSKEDGAGRKVSYAYDLLDRITNVKEGDAITANYQYDTVGNMTSYTDGKGKTTEYTYTQLSQIASIKDPLGNIKSFAYNIDAMLKTVTNANGSKVNYDYNELDQLLDKKHNEDKAVALNGYDSEGNRISMQDVTGTAKYSYDAAGRPTSVLLSNGTSKITYTYDEFGNLAKLGYPDGTAVTYTYDELDQLISIKDRQGKITFYRYDESGNMIRVERPNSTHSKLEYDAMGRVTSVANCRPIKILWLFTVGAKVSGYDYTYDESGFITSEKVDGAYDINITGFFTWIYSLFFKKNIDTKYEYDVRGQLTKAEQKEHTLFKGSSTVTTYYSYDGAGNRLTKTVVGKKIDNIKENYSYNDADQLVQMSRTVKNKTERVNYTYDANGNLIKTKELDTLCKDERKFTYNNENRLTAVKENGTLLMAALYSGDGDRLFTVNYRVANDYVSNGAGSIVRMPLSTCDKKEAVDYNSDIVINEMLVPNGVKPISYINYELTGYVNDTNRENSQVLMEYGANEHITNTYTYGLNRDSVAGTTGKYYYNYDGRGSVTGLTTDVIGDLDVSYSYDANGTANRRGSILVNNPYEYNGEYTDLAVNMQYLRARYYQPSTGGFLTKDTVLGSAETPLSRNAYTYAHNNPVNYVDPSGNAIGKSSYERQMEAAGGINEIYNFYVGTTLQNNYNRANAAFYGQLNSAKNVDYTNINEINGISQISQGTANYYINRGTAAARAVGATYGCTPGALTNKAISTFSANVNASKNSVNSQITNVRTNKYKENEEFQKSLLELKKSKSMLVNDVIKLYSINIFFVYDKPKKDFIKQADWMKKNNYNNMNVKYIHINTAEDFTKEWNKLTKSNVNVNDLHLFLHGGPGYLYFNDSSLSTSEIKKLNKLSVAGNTYLFSCNGGTRIDRDIDSTVAIAISSRLENNTSVRAATNGSVYYRAWNQLFSKKPLTKEGYWADYEWNESGSKETNSGLGKGWEP